MDNLVAGRAAADSITTTGDGALQIQYVRALLAKAVEQQRAGADSQGRVYSRSSGSRAASSGRPEAANTLNCPPPEPLQLQHRPTNAALSTNDPRPATNFVAAKLKRHSRTLDNIPDLLEIAKRYAEEDPNQETDDE